MPSEIWIWRLTKQDFDELMFIAVFEGWLKIIEHLLRNDLTTLGSQNGEAYETIRQHILGESEGSGSSDSLESRASRVEAVVEAFRKQTELDSECSEAYIGDVGLRTAAQHKSYEDVVLKLIDLCISCQSVKAPESASWLHLAFKHGWRALIPVLRDHGEGLDVKDEEGQAPIHYCSLMDHHQMRASFDTIVVLLQAGADPNIIDGYGRTVLHRLAERQFFAEDVFNLRQFVTKFKEHGGNIGARDPSGLTAAEISRRGIYGSMREPFLSEVLDDIARVN